MSFRCDEAGGGRSARTGSEGLFFILMVKRDSDDSGNSFWVFSGRQLFVWCKCDALEEVGELNG